MTDLTELYQQLIIDHSQRPHNFCILDKPSYTKEGFNPLCGDKINIYVKEKDGIITDISFQGSGCAISTASTSLMSDLVKGKSIEEIFELFNEFQTLITTGEIKNNNKLGKLIALAGVSEFPMRIKCATLPWHTLKAVLLKKSDNIISTE
jgi:nitrogen fixation protein NifU and related proteins